MAENVHVARVLIKFVREVTQPIPDAKKFVRIFTIATVLYDDRAVLAKADTENEFLTKMISLKDFYLQYKEGLNTVLVENG